MQKLVFSGALLAIALLALIEAPAPAAADVSVSLQPHPHCIEPEQLFTITVWVDNAGSAFDGYETVIRFDGALLTVESVQEGSLMTGLCGNTWWWTSVGPDSVIISHVAMCGGESLSGPGALSSITFAAGPQPGDAALTFDFIEFYLAGNLVASTTSDGLLQIREDCASGVRADVTSPVSVGGLLHFSAGPNPFAGETHLTYHLSRDAHLALEILDPAGRRIRVLRAGAQGSGWTRAAWDGRDDAHRLVPPGAYFGRLTSGGETLCRRLLLLR